MGSVSKRAALMKEVASAVYHALGENQPVERDRQRQKARAFGKPQPHSANPSFNPEPTGVYTATTDRKSRSVSMLHGEIVNSLADQLAALGYKAVNKGVADEVKPDIVVMGSKRAIIEVKTGCTWQDIKDVLGQLFLYKLFVDTPENIELIAVVPSNISEKRAAVLSYYGIRLIKWERSDGCVIFKGLEDIFPRIPSPA
ncbi:hypothetical protein [Candidatus Solincola tengchongensis]|uniref:hypothetical protein n=1 Tax=Candidatus Solincola tengchongensis TaxID=2900693 RepID=UPI00257C1E22|nr:hypothetical protein [Candidatus Solincola tengchongensis]